MEAFFLRYCGWWDWRLSSRFRAASLGSIWLLLVVSPWLGPLLVPLGILRFGASGAQLLLNRQLGRLEPVEPRGWPDWLLLGVTLLASMAVAEVSQVTGSESTFLLIPVAIPFSAIQLRMCRKSGRAFAQARVSNVVRFEVERRLAA